PGALSDARPNNILAPYWADLDGTGADGIRVATISRDSRDWIVVEWRVKLYGTDQALHFQAWIGTGTDEAVRFAYDPGALPHGAKAFAIGAKNALGKGQLLTAEPSTDYAVKTSGSRPGGTLDYTVRVQGMAPADAQLVTSMTSEGVPGVTVVQAKLRVVSP